MKNKSKKWLFLGILFLLCVSITILFFSNGDSRLNGNEREWITNNQNHVQNVAVVNDVNMLGNAGKGIFYSFLTDLQNEYNIKLNYITLGKKDKATSLAFQVGDAIPEHAFEFYSDHFVLVGKNDTILYQKNELPLKKIGVPLSVYETVKNYFLDISQVDLISYQTDFEMFSALDNGDISYMVVPRQEYLDTILKKYSIAYHLSDLKRYYYVVDESDSIFYKIICKYYKKWKNDKFSEYLGNEERTLFINSLNISNSDLDGLQKRAMNYALKPSLAFEVFGNHNLGGILGEYMSHFSEFSKIDFKYQQYHNDKNLENDFQAGKIGLMSNVYNNLQGGVLVPTMVPVVAGVVVDDSSSFVFDSINSLKDKVVYLEENSILGTYVSKYVKEVKTVKNSELSKVMRNKDSILLLDLESAKYFVKHYNSSCHIAYQFYLNATYAIRSYESDVFNKLMAKYFNYYDSKEAVVLGSYHAREMEVKNSFLGSLARYALYAILITVVILIIIFRSSKKVRLQKKVKKEDKLKYVDHLTSLKNRNYLNDNLEVWNKNTIYPQAVIVVDLNRVQEINDTFGYEEGDKQIGAAASILIKTQLDNTDIIRTDGNEFMIYLVGYSTKQITSYLHKLTKEFKGLPYENGVCLSYSMIESDTKSIEDALNECVEDIKAQKEKIIKEEEK